jgi:hypothetical protein
MKTPRDVQRAERQLAEARRAAAEGRQRSRDLKLELGQVAGRVDDELRAAGLEGRLPDVTVARIRLGELEVQAGDLDRIRLGQEARVRAAEAARDRALLAHVPEFAGQLDAQAATLAKRRAEAERELAQVEEAEREHRNRWREICRVCPGFGDRVQFIPPEFIGVQRSVHADPLPERLEPTYRPDQPNVVFAGFSPDAAWPPWLRRVHAESVALRDAYLRESGLDPAGARMVMTPATFAEEEVVA